MVDSEAPMGTLLVLKFNLADCLAGSLRGYVRNRITGPPWKRSFSQPPVPVGWSFASNGEKERRQKLTKSDCLRRNGAVRKPDPDNLSRPNEIRTVLWIASHHHFSFIPDHSPWSVEILQRGHSLLRQSCRHHPNSQATIWQSETEPSSPVKTKFITALWINYRVFLLYF